MSEYRIMEIRISDDAYPEQLRNIPKPPEILYCIGNISLLKTAGLAVVGSRKCSEYGRQVAMKIGRRCAENGVTLISGMAKGIDGFAHTGALKNGGKSIAVLGNGVDICYPKDNRHIYDRLAYDGLIVSELPPGTVGRAFTFPQRNRIISGLSKAVCVVEAGTNSGSLITAELAVQQGRDVFAVPGNITSAYSLGTNKLISDGAICVSVIDDMFSEMGICGTVQKEELEQLGEDEARIYKALCKGGEVTVDWLSVETGMSSSQVAGLVSVLEMKGLAAYSLGRVFICR